MSLHADAVATLRSYAPAEEGQRRRRDEVLALLAARDDATVRACPPGHVTAGALVVDPGGRVLLTHHPKFGRWLQLGGHLEPTDPTLADAALREATEESGIDGLTLVPGVLDVDVHPVPCPGPGGAHHDVRYLVLAPADAEPRVSEESLDLGWFGLEELDTLTTEDSLRRAARAAVAVARAARGEPRGSTRQ
jgi:8-oxo-dGTP pyrophosphatase MutT (NUDIX family)